MRLVDSSVISEPVEFIFNLLNVVVIKHFFVFSYETVKFIPNTLYTYIYIYGWYTYIYIYMDGLHIYIYGWYTYIYHQLV